MFSFYNKKYLLAEHLNDFIDIHNHVLPGIDDGAQNVTESIALIEKFQALGIHQIISTPHIMNDYYPNTPSSINEALQLVREKLDSEGNNFQIKAAAEYMMDQSFLEILEQDKLLCLAQNLVLVEMSYFQPPINLNEILFQIQTKQYKPLLAHPERYAFYHGKTLNNYIYLKDRGCLFQLNLLSLVGHYGSNIQSIAFKLLENEMIDFLGTDTHQLRHLEKLQAAKVSSKHLDLLKPLIEKNTETFQFQ